MRIVIDMQGAQGASQHRGIGRYTLSLAKALIRNRGTNEIFLVVNGYFPEAIGAIRSAIDGLLPQENIRVWYPPQAFHYQEDMDAWYRNTAELLREAFLASLKPDMVLVSSLFEGFDDDAVTSVGKFSSMIPACVILYDLIPLIHRDIYLNNPLVENWYEEKLAHLLRANILLAISESSRQEALRYVGFPPDACVNISGAVEGQFYKKELDSLDEQTIRARYGLSRQFIMYTGGIDYRKNVEGLIKAYARLPNYLRAEHQLAVVCSIQPSNCAMLMNLAKKAGLRADELVLTGFVSDDDLLNLYNLCKVFVFPSWHEGFGLPALEAMSCGRAVIGANTSSLPEVIGKTEALFDPKNHEAIADKLIQVLTDDAFRLQLEEHGLKQAKQFSWDISAQRAMAAFEAFHKEKIEQSEMKSPPLSRPKLAYLSPLPAQRSGISDYSAELLPELARHYDIDVIVMQDVIASPWIIATCAVRTIDWFKTHSARYDRVLYHFGNSDFHQHMFRLLVDIPGVVVLHDFFLSGIISHMDTTDYDAGIWAKALYEGHGYPAVKNLFEAANVSDIILRYPCNVNVLRNAQGMIVHSDYSRRLAVDWYGEGTAEDWAVIPLLRTPSLNIEKSEARCLLNIRQDDFIVCSFGIIAPTKLNHSLIQAWLGSALALNRNAVLIFVGENDGGAYGEQLFSMIKHSGLGQQIRITGWVDSSSFRHYLAAADVGVQLRTFSRGETSAAVLDCMNHALPTIVNANGSMADLPKDGVWMLPDEFKEAELINALETLYSDSERRKQLGLRAQAIIHANHAPRACADRYAEAIEVAYQREQVGIGALIQSISEIEPSPMDDGSWQAVAQAIVHSIPPRVTFRQLFVDISGLILSTDTDSQAQTMMHHRLTTLLEQAPEGLRVEPIYATMEQGYRYARRFILNFLGCAETGLQDDIIEYRAGDVFWGFDIPSSITSKYEMFYQQLHHHGVTIHFDVPNELFQELINKDATCVSY